MQTFESFTTISKFGSSNVVMELKSESFGSYELRYFFSRMTRLAVLTIFLE